MEEQKERVSKKQKFNAVRLCLLGRSGTGKTYSGSRYILSLVKRGFISPKRLIVFSATWKSDPSVKDLIDYCQSKNKRFKDDHCFEVIDTTLIMKIYETQKVIKESRPDKLKSWLLYFDDQITSDLWKHTSRDKSLLAAFTIGRHYQMSIVVGIQRLMGVIAPTLREQFTHIAMFQLGNTKEILDVLAGYNEQKGIDVKKQVDRLYDVYNDAISQEDSHGCLIIHVLVRHGSGRYERGLGSNWFYDIQGQLA